MCCVACGYGNHTAALSQPLYSLDWRHNGRDGVCNHQPHDCLLNRLFGHRSKKASKPRVTGLCVGNSPVTGEFPAQMASNAENVSIWWRYHVLSILKKAKVGGSSNLGEIFCLKNFGTFTRTTVRESKMNAVACAQLTFQMLTLQTKISIIVHTENIVPLFCWSNTLVTVHA